MAEEIKVGEESSIETSDKSESSTERVEGKNSLETVETNPSETEENAEQKTPDKKADSLESALRKFKRQSSGIISEVRKREAYDKPSVKRKKKSKAARRHKKNNRFNGNRW